MAGLWVMQMVSSSAVGEGLSGAGIVGIQAIEIAPAFTPDSASMATEASCNFGIRVTLPLHSIYDISFIYGNMHI
jgi:hypothetical protein